ncbi:hypothetical protein FRC01_002396 [Tulasnella sp. 417]|nr:hypothetical protein FRC01_002396 [Tulasnella sp. 417]
MKPQNACRKQKMKCTDADNPPCKRCRHAGIECIFEKPIRDTANNSEQGMWRIRNLETQVNSIQSTLADLVQTLRAAVPGAQALPPPSIPSPASTATTHLHHQQQQHPATHPTPPQHASPAGYGAPSPAMSNNSGGNPSTNYGNGAPDGPQPSSSAAQNHHGAPLPPTQNYAPNGAMRPYRSSSQSSGRNNAAPYHSSPGPHGNGPQQASPGMHPQQHQDLYRSNSDGHYADHPRPGEQPYPPHPHHPGQSSQPYGAHPGAHSPVTAMPPPTSLPPFSALDVPNRQGPPPVHIPGGGNGGGARSSSAGFSGPLSPRKAMIAATSPTSAYSNVPNVYPPVPHHASHPGYPSAQSHPSGHSHFGGNNHHYLHDKHGNNDPLSSSNVTSADSSDDEGGPSDLPTHGMIAPFTAIRGLADVAERVVEENGGQSDPPTRSGSPSRAGHHDDATYGGGSSSNQVGSRDGGRPGIGGKRGSGKLAYGDPDARPPKRRRTDILREVDANETPARAIPDVVTKGVIMEEEAKELFTIFFTGCSMFLPVFDSATDTYEALHKRSPFCVDAICMVAAKVRDGGGPPSETYKKCLKEVHEITCATLFAPVVRQEAVQAMLMVAGWGAGPRDSGWLTCGHATRMALEFGMHKAWPKLLKRMHAGKAGTSPEERELVISARTWFCLYLYEHQMSFGTGRPATLKEDESVHECRLLLTHPLAIPDDMRLVSMVELMIIRERTQNAICPTDNTPIDDSTFRAIDQARLNFEGWLHIWSNNFSKRYEAAAFHRQSLEAQVAFAELYHNAIVLRTMKGPDDVAKIRPEQKELALRSMSVARTALRICLKSPSYREGMKYAVQYTHLSATFTASFLMRLARLFPEECDLPSILTDVEELVEILSLIPATRFARTLKLMLRSARRRMRSGRDSDQGSIASASGIPRTSTTPTAPPVSGPQAHVIQTPSGPMVVNQWGGIPHSMSIEQLDQFVREMESMPGQHIPVWLDESNLGDLALSQQGLEAFLIPPTLDDQQRMVPEIW